MPCYEALKAKYLFAVVACDLSLCFLLRFHNNIFAFGIRTELFQDTPHHFLVGFKLSKLFICCFIAHIFYKVIRYRRSAAALRTFNEQTFVSWLGYFISEEIPVTVFAEGVSTTKIDHKISIVMFFIANFAKLWIHNLLGLYKQVILGVMFTIFLRAYQQRLLFRDLLHVYCQVIISK